jgi:hypothetical protein
VKQLNVRALTGALHEPAIKLTAARNIENGNVFSQA